MKKNTVTIKRTVKDIGNGTVAFHWFVNGEEVSTAGRYIRCSYIARALGFSIIPVTDMIAALKDNGLSVDEDGDVKIAHTCKLDKGEIKKLTKETVGVIKKMISVLRKLNSEKEVVVTWLRKEMEWKEV